MGLRDWVSEMEAKAWENQYHRVLLQWGSETGSRRWEAQEVVRVHRGS